MLQTVGEWLISLGEWIATVDPTAFWAVVMGIGAIFILFWDDSNHRKIIERQEDPHQSRQAKA